MLIDIAQVKKWIEHNIKDVHTLENVAKHWQCSAETLRKEFWRNEGRNLSDFIIESKIEKTKKLLIETDLLCKEVCFRAGFRRDDSGAEVFKRHVGMTMVQFRTEHRKGKIGEDSNFGDGKKNR
jgi:AraC-like DNA-binding protein